MLEIAGGIPDRSRDNVGTLDGILVRAHHGWRISKLKQMRPAEKERPRHPPGPFSFRSQYRSAAVRQGTVAVARSGYRSEGA